MGSRKEEENVWEKLNIFTVFLLMIPLQKGGNNIIAPLSFLIIIDKLTLFKKDELCLYFLIFSEYP